MEYLYTEHDGYTGKVTRQLGLTSYTINNYYNHNTTLYYSVKLLIKLALSKNYNNELEINMFNNTWNLNKPIFLNDHGRNRC